MEEYLESFRKIGKRIIKEDLAHSNFGNMSQRFEDKLLITSTGALLDELGKGQIVEVSIKGPSALDHKASTELIVHRAIYRKTKARAVIHAHSSFAVILSLLTEEKVIKPRVMESQALLKEIPVVEGESGSKDLAENVSSALLNHKACIIKGHGTIAIGKSIEEAYINTCSLEHVCKILYYHNLYTRAQYSS